MKLKVLEKNNYYPLGEIVKKVNSRVFGLMKQNFSIRWIRYSK
ncbi:hypothetical protein FLJC2902T_04070 [Flavobacterium limnosediminis JC2902]|uniref:Uncharacterized protein n=1 Tax=Flavobacterium limnosediminis JC2902 TaxID=1341181 RepID=V6STF7_9FLAO|nr:hypothetical protein FLJC2902T_04070 [Flavobacterium limnosediminis JC2902]